MVEGVGLAMRIALERCRLYATVKRPVLLVGPVGAGKTTIARRLHQESGRVGDLVPLTSAESSVEMFRDALFGHTRGAFTGAQAERRGALARASEGTLLLDDLPFLEVEAQAALLRTLEDRAFRPIGSDRDLPVTCRFLFASTLSIEALVEDRGFLPDLASRIGDFVIPVP
jgi:DNA-binding NtrC family response regulator